MTKPGQTPTDLWLEQQQAFWEALQAGQPAPPVSDWQTFMQANPFRSETQNDNLTQLLSQNQQLAAEFADLYRNFATRQASADNSNDSLQTLINGLQALLEDKAGSLFAKNWQLSSLLKPQSQQSLQTWQQALDDYFRQLSEQTDSLPDNLISQTHKDQLKTFHEHCKSCRDAFANLNTQHQAILEDTTENLREQLQKQPPESLKQLMDQWTDCYEQAYSQQVFTSEYQNTHAAFNNSLLKLINLQQSLLQADNTQLLKPGFVSQQEYRQSLKQQHLLRKQVKTQAQTIATLEQRLSQLESQLKYASGEQTSGGDHER